LQVEKCEAGAEASLRRFRGSRNLTRMLLSGTWTSPGYRSSRMSHGPHKETLVQFHIKVSVVRAVIPACFWPESRQTAWIPAFAGMTQGTWTLICVEWYLVMEAWTATTGSAGRSKTSREIDRVMAAEDVKLLAGFGFDEAVQVFEC
jgi:hypothetical protein